jgi:MoaA/NifB/PqqE/SkfB family radical SAM enzyme
VDLRGWGESTMLPWFSDVIDVALAYRPQLRLVTNGQVNRTPVWDKLMRAHAMVVVSCDAATPELFTRLRGGGRLPRLKETVRELVRLRDEYGVPDRNVELISIASPDNLAELPAIIDLAAELDVRKVTVNPIQTQVDACNHLRRDLPGASAAYAAAAARARETGVLMQLGAAPDSALAVPGMPKSHPCMHPWSYAYVDYAGRAGFCDHLIGNDNFTFESLADRSFEEIWNGPEWQALRRQHAAGEISDRFFPCRWCFKNRYVDFEDRVNPAYRSRIVSTETVEHVAVPSAGPPEPPLPFF